MVYLSFGYVSYPNDNDLKDKFKSVLPTVLILITIFDVDGMAQNINNWISQENNTIIPWNKKFLNCF